MGAHGGTGGLQWGPTWGQRSAKRAQDAIKMEPRSSHDGARWGKDEAESQWRWSDLGAQMEASWRPDVGRGRACQCFLEASWSKLATFGGASWEWLVDARGPHEQQLGTNAGPVQARLGALGGRSGVSCNRF